ncbi:MAG: flagellar hook-length control protein FliK [Kiritimatiellae bacterium]|nr:flagellar hook-length control protein FliK [Kiritimatiellia bacterium]
MSTNVSGLERVGESTTALREADPAAEKTTAFEVLLGGVLNDAQEREPNEYCSDDTAQQSTWYADDSKKENGEDLTVSSTKKSDRLEQSLVSVYAYESAQPVFAATDYSGAVQQRSANETSDTSAEGETHARSAEESVEKTVTDVTEDAGTEKTDQSKESEAAAEDGENNSETEEAVETVEESEDVPEEVAEEPEAEVVEEPVSAEEEEGSVEEAEGDSDAVPQPVAEEEDVVDVEDGDEAAAEDPGERPVALADQNAGGEESLEEGQDGMMEQPGQEGNAPAAEMAAQASSARVAEGDPLSSDFLAELMQQAETPTAASGSETLVRIEQIQQLADRFDQHILSMIRRSDQDMTITISPESLGKLVVRCHEESDGVRVHVHAENASVCNLLQQQESGIRQALNQNGYKLAEFDVSTENGESAEQRRERMMNEREEEQRNMPGGARGMRGEAKEAAPARTAQRMDPNGVWLIA